jgi:hypothetical protein
MTQMRRSSEINAAERAEIFHEQYGNEIDAGATLADIVIAAGDYLRRIVGDGDADAAMTRMVEGVVSTSGQTIRNPSEWRGALDESRSSCFSEWPIGAKLHDLAAYAIYGIFLDDSEDGDQLAAEIEHLVTEAREFLDATPVAHWKLPANNDLVRLVRLASNRWALDNGRPIEPSALAEFGGVSEGRIRNLMSGPKRAFASEDGLVPAREALTWLSEREEYWNSIWREQRMPRYETDQTAPLTQAVFVPVARDGSIFHPGLSRGTGYTIGEKGDEMQVADFNDALMQLQRMRVPHWRRPNDVGNWGIVSGVRWVRIDTPELDIFTADPSHRVSSTRN